MIDVSEHVDADGVLRWQAPAGRWTVLRFGFTPLGTLNRSAPDTGVGLECDKYSAEAVAFHFDRMMQPLLPILAPLTSRGRMGLEIDSWEVGMQNWTPGFEKEFEARNGYGLLPYLPAMTGRVVGSVDTTERFLWDLRRTQADLLADNYYGKLAELCHRHGMKLFAEPYDRGPDGRDADRRAGRREHGGVLAGAVFDLPEQPDHAPDAEARGVDRARERPGDRRRGGLHRRARVGALAGAPLLHEGEGGRDLHPRRQPHGDPPLRPPASPGPRSPA